MPEVAGGSKQVEDYSSFSRLVAFKPRQVLLAEKKQLPKQQPGLTMTKKHDKEQLNQKTDVLKDDQKLALLHSVVKYISDKGFAKTLKKFLKEAQVKDDAWKGSSIDLECIYSKYLETCRNDETKAKSIMEQGECVKGTMLKDAESDVVKDLPSVIVNKKKKKKNKENDDSAKSSVPAVKSDNSTEDLKGKEKKQRRDKETLTEDGGNKKKKKTENDEDVKSSVPDVKQDDSLKEPADKKKKKKKSELTSESQEENGTLDSDRTEAKEKKKGKKDSLVEASDNGAEVFVKAQSHATLDAETDNKSKKRKRSASDESNETQTEVVEDFKKRKTEGLKEAEVNGETKEDNGTGSQLKTPKPTKEFDESEKGSLMSNGVGKFSDKKSAKKLRNGSAEPKTVNAFQRVKVDAVEFADERLQDNSYWAKGGAETGYGAKAQEILGQVKGR
ncbi:OLC1v1008007C6 [Oldenlandia corymbosa var. corymbosa]|nr:OLC1v1008007C6 [Oldenlandia corymbosa var. corymbosa]